MLNSIFKYCLILKIGWCFIMDIKKLEHYKDKLLNEKRKVQSTISLMKKNETIDSNAEISSELSFYDNHPADLGEELSDIAKGKALEGNELSIISKIDDALRELKEGSYGICKDCNAIIPEARLDFIPYANFCVSCQNTRNNMGKASIKEKPIEDTVLSRPFGYGFNDNKGDSEFDAEDSYQAVARYNNIEGTPNYYEDEDESGYVDPMDQISNEQYKNQLPD